MTTLEQLNLSQPLTDVYTAMETDLMVAIARQLAAGGEINATSEWRLKKLAETGNLNRETVKIIASYTGIQSDLLTETIESAAAGIVDRLEPALQACAADGFVTYQGGTPISEGTKNVVKNFRKQAKTDLNLVNTVMQYKAGSSYKNLVNKIYDESNRQELLSTLGKHTLATATGAETRQEAVRNCIREFSQKGIPAFVDKAGREWSPEAYINMDIKTTVSNTAHAAQDAVCDRYGIDLIEISSHMGARPKCALDQGKIFSRSNQSGVAHDGNGNEIPFYPWSSSSYGQPDGILGINCHHNKYPFVDGVNFQTYFPYDQEENAARYKEFQKQRSLERKVRQTSREADMLKAMGDEEGAKAARKKLAEQRKAYRDYSDSHGLKQHSDRLTVTRVRNGDNVFADIHKGGGIIGNSAGNIQTAKKFVPAKTVEEAQAYAKSIGVEYPDYSKFTAERANNMNSAISTLPDDAKPYLVTDLQKLPGVTGVPLGKNQKNGYACTVTPYEIDLKRAGIADTETLYASGKTVIAVNTRNYKTLDSLTESKLKSEETVISQGRGKAYHFNKDGGATAFHECGHAYADKYGLPQAFSVDADQWYRETDCLILKNSNEAWAEAYAAYYTHADDLPSYIRRYFDDGEWKTDSGSKVLSLDEWNKKVLTNGNSGGTIKTGAYSGALNPNSEAAVKHAAQYYESVRHMTGDIERISQNTGFKSSNIKEIKNHVFMEKHDLGGDAPEYFYPDYDMAQSWQRLIDGKNIQPCDYVLLKHEYAELLYMQKGYSQQDAHDMANRKYNYKEALENRGEK